jgi:hypothetical protein
MTVLKIFTSAVLFLIISSVKLHGQDFKIIIPDTEYGMYYGVTGDIGNDGDMDIVGPNTYSKESKILILENNASAGSMK